MTFKHTLHSLSSGLIAAAALPIFMLTGQAASATTAEPTAFEFDLAACSPLCELNIAVADGFAFNLLSESSITLEVSAGNNTPAFARPAQLDLRGAPFTSPAVAPPIDSGIRAFVLPAGSYELDLVGFPFVGAQIGGDNVIRFDPIWDNVFVNFDRDDFDAICPPGSTPEGGVCTMLGVGAVPLPAGLPLLAGALGLLIATRRASRL